MLDEVVKNYSHRRLAGRGAWTRRRARRWPICSGLANVDVVRAVAAVDAPLPRMVELPETDPVASAGVLHDLGRKERRPPAVEAGIKRLRDMKYPVSVQEVGDQPRYLTTEELQQLVRWFDSLDRI